jgi:hypothetical protein
MNSAPQVQTQEISDADLDNVSGGVFAGLAGEVSLESPLPVDASGAVGFGSTATL